jgi:Homoserine dehydrogenase
MEPIKVGLLGFGTVGSGTFTVLRRNQEEIKRRAGRGMRLRALPCAIPPRRLRRSEALPAQWR